MTLRLIRTAAFAAPLLFPAPLLLAATGAQAHAHLVKAAPAENATVAAPQTLNLQFSEKLEGKFSGADLMKADGTPVAVKSTAADKAITAVPAQPLTPGAYMVMWHVVSTDGHKMKGQYDFTVQ